MKKFSYIIKWGFCVVCSHVYTHGKMADGGLGGVKARQSPVGMTTMNNSHATRPGSGNTIGHVGGLELIFTVLKVGGGWVK